MRKSAYLARAVKPGRSRNASFQPLPAPVLGWITAGSLAARPSGSAARLENWRPTSTGISQRGGSLTHASVSDGSEGVISLMAYNTAATKKLFGATETEIFDITTVVDPDTPPAAAVTDQTAGYYSFLNFTTTGGSFLTAVNGADKLLLYEPGDGWKKIDGASTPAITGVDTSTLSFVWAYKNREFFCGGGLFAYCLPVSSIAGPVTAIDLNGVFLRGGSLLFGATWSSDAGDGMDDRCVFVTSEGEVAIYGGLDPGNADDWYLVGRYDLPKPLGPRCFTRSGGDILIGTASGEISLAAAVAQDIEEVEANAVSKNIAPDWQREALVRNSVPWEIENWTERGYQIVSVPSTGDSQEPLAFIRVAETGVWCCYTGWDVRCMVQHNGKLYFGTSDGKVKAAETTGSDDGAPIYYTCVSNPDHFGALGQYKTVLQARAIFRGATPYNASISVAVDYQADLPSPPDAAPDAMLGANLWGSGLWGRARWGIGVLAQTVISTLLASIGRSGFVAQWQLQITGAQQTTPDLELVSIDFSSENGAPVL